MDRKNKDIKLVDDFVRERSDEAFSKIYVEYKKMIYNFVKDYLYFSSTSEAEEIVDDVFVRVYLKVHTLKDLTKFKSWIYQIARNLCKNYIRDKKLKNINLKITDDVVDEKINMEGFFEKKEVKEFVYNEIQKLDDKLRELIILKYYEGLTFSEISKITNISIGNLKYHMKTALNKILEKLIAGGFY